MSTEFGLDEAAWQMWIDYRKDIKKPLRAASIPLAQKRLAALGPQQREAVEYSIANGYQGLFAPKSAKAVVKKMGDEQKKLLELVGRALNCGFREPREGEDAALYRMLLERFEHQKWAREREQRMQA